MRLRLVGLCWVVGLTLGLGMSSTGCGPARGDGQSAGDDGTDGDGDGDGDGGPSWRDCQAPDDCELAFNTCCGTCDRPTLDDYDAINGERRDEHFADACPEPDPICPGCAAAPNPWLGATCDAGQCEGFDLETHPLNTCELDEDCRLRAPGCCECGAPTDVWTIIALPNTTEAQSAYMALVCEPEATCDLCAPAYPDELTAVCRDGHCAVDGR